MQSEEVVRSDEEDEDALVALVALDCDWMKEEEFNVFDDEDNKESMVSKILTEATTKKVIIYILMILMALPLFDILKIEDINAQSPGLILISSPLYDSGINKDLQKTVLENNIKNYLLDYSEEGYYNII